MPTDEKLYCLKTQNRQQWTEEEEKLQIERKWVKETGAERDGKKRTQMKNPTRKVKNGCNYSMSVILMPFFPEFCFDWQNNNTCQCSCLRYNLFSFGLYSVLCFSCSLTLSRHHAVDITFFVLIQLIIQRWAHTKNLHGVRFHTVFVFYGWFLFLLTLWAA